MTLYNIVLDKREKKYWRLIKRIIIDKYVPVPREILGDSIIIIE